MPAAPTLLAHGEIVRAEGALLPVIDHLEEVMAEVTRRRFLVQSSLGLSAAAAGAAVAVAAPRVLSAAAPAPARDLNGVELDGPLVAHVRSVATGEVSLMVGTTETVVRDRELVNRLLGAAVNPQRR